MSIETNESTSTPVAGNDDTHTNLALVEKEL